MTDDQVFQVILIGAVAVLLPIGIYHRVRSMTPEKLDRSKEGAVFLTARVVLAGPFMVGYLAYLINPEWMAWSFIPLPLWLRWTGIIIGVFTGVLLVWTFRTLGKNITDTVVTRKEHTLVIHGPYRWVRHPFYVSFALATLANSLATANWFLFVMGCAAFIMLVLRTSREEVFLIERFGDDYRTYMKRTGRFFPRFVSPADEKA
jgi:protein-S-isoprenylcysteine O-methyltransferase Ste14